MKAAISFFLIFSFLLPFSLQAEEDAEGEAPAEEVIYVELKPSFVTNYQARKIRYLKADITLKVSNGATAEAVSRHTQPIRHNLVMLFSRQLEEELGTMEGKQKLKEDAMQEVIQALEMEGEPADIQDILFTSFIVD